MALLINSSSPVTGEEITNAYVHITDLSSKKDNTDGHFDCTIKMSYYISQEARVDGNPAFNRTRYTFTFDDTSADNIYVQAYSFLKTLPEFTGAVDA